MSSLHSWWLLAGLFTVANCATQPDQQQSNLPYVKIAPGNEDFAFRFYHQIASEEPGKNIFFSPVSISTAFAFLSLGAKSATLSQLLAGLGFNQKGISEGDIHKGFQSLLQSLNRPKAGFELSLGNAIFTNDQFTLLKKFLTDAKNFYQADALPTNFKKPQEAVKQINNYVQKQTHGKIVDVIKDLDSSVLAVLVNYIYFKAQWESPFNRNYTRNSDFFVDAKTKVQVPMMIDHDYYNYYEDKKLSCYVVQVPYKGNVKAFFVLPDQGKLKQVEAALGKDVLLKWEQSLEVGKLALSLPKFSLSTSYDVKKILNKLGVTDVFTDRADLSGITGARNLRVSKTIHKAFLNVRENGTEAAAAAVLQIGDRFGVIPVKFNRPFLFLIVDYLTKAILFMGRVNNPSVEQSQN
uniref:Plasma serine protease inhibitor-like n=1 Tax=Pogona vitticeps TaxID=103695 RepID=A0A6J0V192_9SAUR